MLIRPEGQGIDPILCRRSDGMKISQLRCSAFIPLLASHNKMSDMQGYLSEMEPILKKESREIIDDSLKVHALERLFQLLVDSAISINTHIIAESEFQVPNDYQSTFMTLGENNIFPMHFMVKIAPSVGLRNLVVHKYGRVDLKKMVDDIKNEISDYTEYLKLVSVFLK